MSGYSGTPLAQKLGIRVYLHEPSAHYARLVAPLPPGMEMMARPDTRTDIVHIFAARGRRGARRA